MKSEIKGKIERESCNHENEIEQSRLTRALAIDPSSSTSYIPHSPLPALNNEERRSVEAYQLQVEQRRFMAIELARRQTIR